MILCVVVLTSSFASIHYETVKSAEWVAGAVASVGGGPLLTALLVGGVVVAGGIAVYEFMQTDSEDYSSFYNGVKTGFNEFVAEQESRLPLNKIVVYLTKKQLISVLQMLVKLSIVSFLILLIMLKQVQFP